MNNNLCVFDLDGTLYPKETEITFEIRNRVISEIGKVNDITFDAAQKIYNQLPHKYPNPYQGLNSLNVFPEVYQDVFNSMPVEKYISYDPQLCCLMGQIQDYADIFIISFAPEKYVERVLKALGVFPSIKQCFSVNYRTNYSKGGLFRKLLNNKHYSSFYSIGDDWKNDLYPAKEIGYSTFHVDFSNEETNVYSVLKKLYSMFNSNEC